MFVDIRRWDYFPFRFVSSLCPKLYPPLFVLGRASGSGRGVYREISGTVRLDENLQKHTLDE